MRRGSQSRGESSQRTSRSGVSLREFGRRIGVSGTAVRKAIKAGRLVKSLGKSPTGRIIVADFEAAKIEWAHTTRTSKGVRTDPMPPGSQSPAPPPETSTDDLQGLLHPGELMSASTLIEAQRLATLERARKLRMENEVAQGHLVPADVAAKEAFEAGRIIREAVLNVPARIAGELAAETDPARVQLRLEVVLREALTATANLLVTVHG